MATYRGDGPFFPPPSAGPDFRDIPPPLRTGSGSQAAPPTEREVEERLRRLDAHPPFAALAAKDAPPSIQHTLEETGENLRRTLLGLEATWGLLDEWEGMGSGPTPSEQGAKSPSRPGIQQVAIGLQELSGALHERTVALHERLQRLVERVGGL